MKWTFNYIAITNNINHASILDKAGIQQIMIDAEIIGKNLRQSGKNTVINEHAIADVRAIKNLELSAEILCRINPFYNNTANEVEEAIDCGVDAIMMPMITCMKEFSKFYDMTRGRVKIVPLIETPYSVFKLNEILSYENIDQIHFGLNDLYLALSMRNLFEILLSPIFYNAVDYAKKNSKLIGIGGIGDPFHTQDIEPLLLLNEYLRYGSKSVILARNFFNNKYDIEKIRPSLSAFEGSIQEGYSDEKAIKFDEAIKKLLA
jgi:hypothetical protein